MRWIWQKADWPKFTWNAETLLPLLSSARLEQGKLLAQAQNLGFELGQEATITILVEEAVKTSEIEGSQLNRDAVRSSIAKHLGIPTFGLPQSTRSIDGLVEVLLDATRRYDQLLTEERLKSWQAALFPTGYSGLLRIQVGEWRSGEDPMQVVSGGIGKEVVHFEAVPSRSVIKEIDQFLLWWEKSLDQVDGLLRAGIAHFYFITIHPFEDGNGRVARALTDMALAQDEKISTRLYSLSSQIMKERKQYYEILERSQQGELYHPLVENSPLDSARQSQIEASRSEQGNPSQIGKGDEEDQFGKAAASQNGNFQLENGIDITSWLVWFLASYTRSLKNSAGLIACILDKSSFWQYFNQTTLSDRQRKVVNTLLDLGKGNFQGGLTTRKYSSIAKISRATAFREITDLLEKKVIVQNTGKGRSVSYDLNWDVCQSHRKQEEL